MLENETCRATVSAQQHSLLFDWPLLTGDAPFILPSVFQEEQGGKK
jgi:hypothetical protein